MSISFDSFEKTYRLEMKREMTYSTTLGTDPHGNITRVNNALDNIPKILENSQSQLEALRSQLETAKGELGKPFPHENELNTKIARLAQLNVELNIEGKHEVEITGGKIDVPLPKAADNIAADKAPTDKVADKPLPPSASIAEQIKHYKAVADKQNGVQPPKLSKDKEIQ